MRDPKPYLLLEEFVARFPMIAGAVFVDCPTGCGGTLSDDGHDSNHIVQLRDGRIGMIHGDWSDLDRRGPFTEGNWGGNSAGCSRCHGQFYLPSLRRARPFPVLPIHLGIDIDGTLTRYPDFFIQLGKLWRRAGWRVYLITGLGAEGVEARRNRWPFLDDVAFYDAIIDTSQYNDEERALVHAMHTTGVPSSNEEIVGRFKQRICRELGVGIMFDDMASVHRQFGAIPVFEVK